jgi:ribonuclease BN (tRNA processing enzyme)
VKFQLLPSSFDNTGLASARQHLACFVVDDRVAIDAGSLAFSASDVQREKVRDVLLTHAHLDHIAGLPLFLDDLFSVLEEPLKVHATQEIIDVLERDIFNWSIYPRFSELSNDFGPIVEYVPFSTNGEFSVAHLSVRAIRVNHRVPSVGFVVSDGCTRIAVTGDTANMDEFWDDLNAGERPDVLLIECAFPDALASLAEVSHHLTPSRLKEELEKFSHNGIPVYAINLKPMYREEIIAELESLAIDGLEILEVGRVYDW